jgi:fluoroquinolone resistance protein
VTESIEDETFNGDDWYAEDLADRRYLRCVFSHVDLTEATSRGAVFEECSFHNVRLNASRHLDSAFLRCEFKRCNLFEAEFTGCKLVGSSFHQSQLRPLRIIGGDWSFVALPGADLRGIAVTGARMREADLTGANCADAVITDTDLSGAQLHGASFVKADLRGSDLSALDPTVTGVRDAIINAEQAIVIAQAIGLQIRDTR